MGLIRLIYQHSLGALLAANPSGFSIDDLFIVFFGGNDIRGTSQLTNRQAYRVLFDAVANIDAAVIELIAAGAQNIVVVNAPILVVFQRRNCVQQGSPICQKN